MKTLHYRSILYCALFLLSGCTEVEPEAQVESTHIGVVVDDNTDLSLPNIDVVVTDGENIHAKTLTVEDGSFSIKVRSSHINNAYYLLVGNEHTEQKKVPLQGFGSATYNHDTIRIKGSTTPIVRTLPINDVTANSAVCAGEVVESGGYDVYQRGVCYSTKHSPSVQDAHTSNGKGIGTFSCTLADLDNNVVYYVRAYAINEIGVSYGEETSFVTIEGLPSVLTTMITEVTSYSVQCGGEVTEEGGAPILMRGVCWSTDNSTPTINDNKTENGSGSGDFKSTITGINVTQHQYYIRAYATNRYGTSYGEVIVQENVNPFNLPVVDMDGYGVRVYMVLPYDLAAKTWEDAKAAANNLVAYGYDDWLLPVTNIYERMYAAENEIGGFQNKQYWTSETAGCDYDTWECFAYVYNFGNGSTDKDNVFNMNPSRPIRSVNFKVGF